MNGTFSLLSSSSMPASPSTKTLFFGPLSCIIREMYIAALYDDPKTSSWNCDELWFQSSWMIVTNHFCFDAHSVELLLVHCSGLCAVIRHKDKTLACAVLAEHFYRETKSYLSASTCRLSQGYGQTDDLQTIARLVAHY